MASDITIRITQKQAPKRLGFGIPLILAALEASETPYREYADIDEIKAKFGEDTEVYQTAKLLLMQEGAPAKVAICGSTEKATDAMSKVWREGWRQLLLPNIDREGEDDLKTIAGYIEAKKDKMLFATVHKLDDLTPLASSDFTRLAVCYHPADNLAAALVGASAAMSPGSFTYKNLILKSVTPLDLTATEIEEIHKKGAITFVTKAGDNVTTEGMTVSGEFIDNVDSADYVIQQLEYNLQKTLNSIPKVPYDNRGIALLEGVTVNVLQDAYRIGIIADNEKGLPDYTVSFLTRDEVDPADRTARQYMGGSFSFGLAGAVHGVDITGQIIV